MEQTVRALGELLLKALPTILLVLLLHFYLRLMFYKPMDKLLGEREQATGGARKLAQESLEKAERKAAEYDQALRTARNEIYREQEQMRHRWREQQADAVREAREQATAMSRQARQALEADTQAARQTLAAGSEALAEQIAGSLLIGRAH